MAKISVSALTPKSQHIMAKKISMEDLEMLCKLHEDVVLGNKTVDEYRKVEADMIVKYGFKVKA